MGELALQQWRERTAASRKLKPWWSPEEQQTFGTDTSKKEQLVDQDFDKFPVIDAKDILKHLMQNRPVSKSSSSDVWLSANFEKKQDEENDQKEEEEEEEEKTSTEKWERHAEALQAWRMATELHWKRYGLVHKKHQEYMHRHGRGTETARRTRNSDDALAPASRAL